MMLVICVVYGVVVVAASIVPGRSRYSFFERTRRHEKGDQAVAFDLRRETLADDVAGVLRVVTALTLVLFVLLALTTFGLVAGSLLAVVGVVFYGTIARFDPVHEASQRLYSRVEQPLLEMMSRHRRAFRVFRDVPRAGGETPIASRAELLHTVDQLPHLLDKHERQLIRHGLAFGDTKVESVMTPRSVMDVVQKNEMMGPLVLDELHKTGHNRFPVIDGDVDHVIGVLYTRNLLTLHDKKTHCAEELMSTPVHYIKEDQTLDHALAAFLKTHHHLFIVVNEYRETVGILTLEDTIEALLGRKIVDEFDAHDDLRAVAERNPRGNNAPAQHKDV